ncbi:MAG: RagB/SusD family nutrient uptake outer membrane protein [Chitinophagaceae bacterium]|nr:RagB/SusD family nutrient uptake outer membrane protein [Chitinophagaceae bacterium]
MKKLQSFLLYMVLILLVFSCRKEFLDKAPGVDLTENTVFQSKANLESFVASIYKYAMHSVFRYRDQQNYSTTVPVTSTAVAHPTSGITEEGDASEANFINTNTWNSGLITSDNIVAFEDFRYYIRWIALRQIALVTKRAKEVPAVDPAATTEYIDQVIAEVKFLRALNYFEMIKRYGGVPIVDSVFAAQEQANIPRSSLDSCIRFILKDCDEAIASTNLPARYSTTLTGRVNKVAVYALKAKVLLYAASPQFNTGTPLINMANGSDNRLICLGNTDPGRWTAAADAAREALDAARSNGYALINNPAARKNNALSTTGLVNNYRVAWETYNNSEQILMYQGFNTSNVGNPPFSYVNPTCMSVSSSWSGISVPLNFLRRYEDTLGNIVNWDAGGGSDLLEKYNALDRRFKQTMCYTTSYYNPANPSVSIFAGGTHYRNCTGGLWMRKYLPGVGGNFVMNDPVFLVNELYLNYAEALNESGQLASAISYTDSIRIRSGQPPLPTTLNQTQLRERIRNERAIELCFDDQHFWDLRRWLINPDGILRGPMQGLQISRVGAGTAGDPYKYSWLPYAFETRTFNANMYLHPFPLSEVLKGNLVQNPGW